MRNFLRGRVGSFRPAFEGFAHVLRTQPNAWIHSFISLLVIVAGLWVQLDLASWAFIVLAMAMVWVIEFANTAIEAAVDIASPKHHTLAKVAKDVSAAAVVIGVIAAVVIGILVLGPRLWESITVLISPK